MSNVPKLRFPEFNGEWEEKKLGECLTLLYGKDWKDKSSTKKLYPVLGTGGVISYIDEFIYDKPCVLIGRKGSINNPVFIDKPFWTVDTQFYSEIHEGYSPKFLYYIFCTENWSKHDESTGVPSLSAKNVENTHKHIPSYSEQQKIADFLSNVDSIITAETKILNTLQKKKKNLMQKLFTRQLRFKSADDTDFPEWEEKKLGEIAEFKQGYQILFSDQIQEPKEGYLRYLYISDFISDKKILYVKDEESYYHISEKDICVANTGATSGKPFRGQSGILSNNMFKIFLTNVIDEDFAWQFFNSPCYENELQTFMNGAGQPHIGHKNMSSIHISLPCKAEQQKIADCLSSMDLLIKNQQKIVTAWQQRKKALLQQMFI